jgi:hypothetical protein
MDLSLKGYINNQAAMEAEGEDNQQLYIAMGIEKERAMEIGKELYEIESKSERSSITDVMLGASETFEKLNEFTYAIFLIGAKTGKRMGNPMRELAALLGGGK